MGRLGGKKPDRKKTEKHESKESDIEKPIRDYWKKVDKQMGEFVKPEKLITNIEQEKIMTERYNEKNLRKLEDTHLQLQALQCLIHLKTENPVWRERFRLVEKLLSERGIIVKIDKIGRPIFKKK